MTDNGKCPQVRVDSFLPKAGDLTDDQVACPACGKLVKVAYYNRKEGPVAFVPAHVPAGAAGQKAPRQRQGSPTAPIGAEQVVGRVRVPMDVRRTRQHEWVVPGGKIACVSGSDCQAWATLTATGEPFAVCRRCGCCWDCATETDAGDCPGSRVRWPDADLIAQNGAEKAAVL